MLKYSILFLLIFSPLPLASVLPVWQMFWVCFVALITMVWVAYRIKQGKLAVPGSHLSKLPALPMVLWGVFIVWGMIQSMNIGLLEFSLPNLDSDKVNEIWLNMGSLSISPNLTIINSLYFASHLLFFVLVFSYIRRRGMANNFLKLISSIITLYALYGFIVYVTGNESILWYDKWAYKHSLTSVFVNRNSFATYLGLGLICTLAWGINHFKSSMVHGLEKDTRLLDFINRFSEGGWIAVLSFFILISALMLTGSRAGMVSTLAGLGTFVILWQRDGVSAFKIKKRYLFALSFSLILGALALSGDQLELRLMTDASEDLRFKAYPLIWQAIVERPFTGYGLGSFIEVFRLERNEAITAFFDRGHSDYLELMLTAGIPMALVFLSIPISLLVILGKARKNSTEHKLILYSGMASTVIVGLHAILDFSLQMPAVSYVYVAIMAVSTAVAVRSR